MHFARVKEAAINQLNDYWKVVKSFKRFYSRRLINCATLLKRNKRKKFETKHCSIFIFCFYIFPMPPTGSVREEKIWVFERVAVHFRVIFSLSARNCDWNFVINKLITPDNWIVNEKGWLKVWIWREIVFIIESEWSNDREISNKTFKCEAFRESYKLENLTTYTHRSCILFSNAICCAGDHYTEK